MRSLTFSGALLSFTVFFCTALPISTHAAPVTVAGFELFGLAGNEASFNASHNDADLETATLSRGAGITAAGLANAFSSNAFVVSGTKASATTTNEYYQVSLQSKNGKKLSLDHIAFNVRRSATGPNAYQWQYSLDGFATPGVDIGAEGLYTGTENNGLAMPAIDLLSIPALQKVKNVTFRLYAWGATTGAGTLAIGRLSGNDLIFSGDIGPNNIIAFEQAGQLGNEITRSATELDTNLLSSQLSRGSGIIATTVNDAFGASGFDVSATSTDAIANNEYIEFSAITNVGYHASLDRIEFNLRRSAQGPTTYQWYYSQDQFSTSGTAIGAPIEYTGVEANGVQMATVVLSNLLTLQNTSATTFRLYAWGATSAAGTFSIGRLAGNDLVVVGEVDINQYTVEYLAGVGGSISGSATQIIDHGGATTPVTPLPQLGFEFLSWSDTSTSSPRTDTNITGGATYTAQFSLILIPEVSRGGPGGFTPPPGIGNGERDETVAMNTERDIGAVFGFGLNALIYINSTATFTVAGTNADSITTGTLSLKYADLYRNVIRVQFGYPVKEYEMFLGQALALDLDGDSKTDIRATFVHTYVNRIEITLEPYREEDKNAITTPPLKPSTGRYQFTRDLKTLSIGADVRELQKFLNANGYILSNTGPGSPGQETQKFGASTRNALIRYQKANNIQPSIGIFGPITRGFVNK